MAQLLGPVIGSSLLLIGIYPPFYFALPVSFLSIPLALLLPTGSRNNPRQKAKRLDNENPHARSEEAEGLLNAHTNGDELETPEGVHQPPLQPIITRHRSLKSVLTTGQQELKRFWKLFTAYRIVQYGYAACLVVTLGKQALHILLQYVSKRFNVSIAEVKIPMPETHCMEANGTHHLKGWLFVYYKSIRCTFSLYPHTT